MKKQRKEMRITVATGPDYRPLIFFQGNDLFRSGDWKEAAEKYRDAIMCWGPQPVYLSNLAAALLKLELCVRFWAFPSPNADQIVSYRGVQIRARRHRRG